MSDSVGVELEPVDSCAINNGGCAHSCRHEDGGAVCSCRKGYILQIDKKSCLGESTVVEPLLLKINQSSVVVLDVGVYCSSICWGYLQKGTILCHLWKAVNCIKEYNIQFF